MQKSKQILVLGGSGFIGNHLVAKLQKDGHHVTSVDLNKPKFSEFRADKLIIADLRKISACRKIINNNFDEIYQLAADMGGAGFTFTGENDAQIITNSALINVNVGKCLIEKKFSGIFFFSSSACIYPKHNQTNPKHPQCSESSAYPADPDSDYGWEKLFSERVYQAINRNHNIRIRIARFHNIYGPQGLYDGGREKFPAAICRKVANAKDGDQIEVWGDGKQTRSFLYIDECLTGVEKLMKSDYLMPINIGSDRMISIDNLAKMIIKISGKKLRIKHIPGPQGVKGRNSNNILIQNILGWKPSNDLEIGMRKTYKWINSEIKQVNQKKI